ncbi:MAG: hypothetical protein Q7S27_05100 [Nanoarchaeota archaeon]|nr:hypothetical protein [Nanoarchaeota archaeon]
MSIEIKIKKKRLYAILSLSVIILLLSTLAFYISHLNKEKQIIEYKSAVYSSLLCQFSCPVKEILIKEQKNIVPDPECISLCTRKLKENNLDQNKFNEKDLLNDNLLSDIDTSINQCRKDNTDENTSNINYEKYYKCNVEKLISLKNKYNYLNTL